MVMSMVLNVMPNTTMSKDRGQALCSDFHAPVSCKSHPDFWKSFSALSGGATSMKSSK